MWPLLKRVKSNKNSIMKKQIVVVHGGDTFDTYEEFLDFLKNRKIDFDEYRTKKDGWKRNLGEELGSDFEIIMPDMPNKINAKYSEWLMWFEKFLPHFNSDVVFVGHSLGGTFIAKYLSENIFPKKIVATFLVAPAYDDTHSDYSMADFKLPDSLNDFAKQGGKIFIYGSTDDPIVPPVDFENYENRLGDVVMRRFTDRGHFNQEELPELIEDIKNL